MNELSQIKEELERNEIVKQLLEMFNFFAADTAIRLKYKYGIRPTICPEDLHIVPHLEGKKTFEFKVMFKKRLVKYLFKRQTWVTVRADFRGMPRGFYYEISSVDPSLDPEGYPGPPKFSEEQMLDYLRNHLSIIRKKRNLCDKFE